MSPSYVLYGTLSAYLVDKDDAFNLPNGENKHDSLEALTDSHPANDLN